MNHCLEDKNKEIDELKHLLKELADKPVEHHDEVVVSEHEDEESDHEIPELEANVLRLEHEIEGLRTHHHNLLKELEDKHHHEIEELKH